MPDTPLLLFIGGHDPSGGAGIQADIETALAHGCRALSLVTCLTTQDSHNIRRVFPQDEATFREQLDCLLDDLRPAMVKIGLVGSPSIARILGDRTAPFPRVIDPVLAAGGGRDLADREMTASIREELLPGAILATPNRNEARRLAGEDDPARGAQRLLEDGCAQVLLTGADEPASGKVCHQLLGTDGQTSFEQPLLPHRYHGSGCTLAAACACNLAIGMGMQKAVQRALDWTWLTLERAGHPGSGQFLPNRRGPLP